MPPRNAPLPNAVNLFNCAICDKGYPRQVDYENHLRSYDHNHRQRLAEMKKLTAANEGESSRPAKGVLDMRSIPVDDAARKPGTGPRFTKIGGAGGGRFKKVGVAVSGSAAGYNAKPANEPAKDVPPAEPEARVPDVEMAPSAGQTPVPAADGVTEKQAEPSVEEDVVMAEVEDVEDISWEEYDFTKPTDCDHASCAGCKLDRVYDNGWIVLDAS